LNFHFEGIQVDMCIRHLKNDDIKDQFMILSEEKCRI
jgi:hypothetical protein